MARKFQRGKAHITPTLTMNEEILAHLEAWADEEDRSLSSQIAYIIKRAVTEKYGAIQTEVKITHRRARTDDTGNSVKLRRTTQKGKPTQTSAVNG